MMDVVVIGGCNLDVKARGANALVHGTSNPGQVFFTPGGVGRNISHNLGLLGLNVALISMVGQDAAGDLVLQQTQAAGVDVTFVQRVAQATGSYVAVLQPDGEMLTAVNDMAALQKLDCDVLKQAAPFLTQAKLIIADCNLELPPLQWLAEQFGHKLLVEPVSVAKSQKLHQLLLQHEIFLATPNRDQLFALTGESHMPAACHKLHQAGLKHLVIHLGAEGCLVSTPQTTRAIPSQATAQVLDVTGAGDAAVAGLSFGICRGHALELAAELGQAAASLVLTTTASTASSLQAAQLETMIRN